MFTKALQSARGASVIISTFNSNYSLSYQRHASLLYQGHKNAGSQVFSLQSVAEKAGCGMTSFPRVQR